MTAPVERPSTATLGRHDDLELDSDPGELALGGDAGEPSATTSGQRRRPRLGTVFIPSAVIAVLFVLGVAIFPNQFGELISAINSTVVESIGWYYVLLTIGFVLFSLYVGLSAWGDVRLGRDDSEPEYSVGSWFAMLFAAGMGIGLVFWGVAEPLNHLAAPPPGTDPATPGQAASGAMATTFLHWGLHAWAIYVVVGLSIALAVHRRGRPISIRWALEPIFGKRVHGRVGDVIDIVAVISTIFGVASSLGLGVMQIAAGSEFLGLIDSAENVTFLLIVVIVVTGMALVSAVSGVDRGIKMLSNGNLMLAALLVLTVFVLGPSLFIAREFVQNIGAYAQNFVQLSFRTFAYQGPDGESWMSSWTTYYWGWWIAWSPFVGIFIARISRGRTVREFVAGVLLVPTLVAMLWFSVLGGSAIHRQLFGSGGLVGADGSVDTNSALFALIEGLPGAAILAGLFILLIVIYFVTSADSGAFVVAMLSTEGDPNPPVWTRAFWAAGSGAVAAVLLWAGAAQGSLAAGLTTIQIVTIVVAAPFSIVMILLCVATTKTLHSEHQRRLRREAAVFRRELHDDVVESVLNNSSTAPLPVVSRGLTRVFRFRGRGQRSSG